MVESGDESAIRAPKLATVVAHQIEDEVIARGWREGEVLGSEADLLAQFGVSRAVLREAVRIVEHSGAARMKRGPGGGLVISAFNRTSVTTALSIWLGYVGVSVGEVFDARTPLLVEAVRVAAGNQGRGRSLSRIRERIHEMADARDLRVPDLVDLDLQLARTSGNPAIALFVEVLSEVITVRLRGSRARLEPAPSEQERRQQLEGYKRVCEAIETHDHDAATAEIIDLTGFLRTRLREQPRHRQPADSDDHATPKLAERVAEEIRDDIEREGWPVDEVIGSEADLIERYGVSRAILREAVRILEYHGAIRTKRGPGGGLVVSVPDGASVLRSARIALEYEGITKTQLIEVRSALDVASARSAADRLTDERAEMIRQTLDYEQEADDRAVLDHDVHRQLAVASGSRSLALFVDIIAEIVSQHIRPQVLEEDALADMAAQTRRAHERIVESVLQGDGELAARRMLRHLNASVDVLQ